MRRSVVYIDSTSQKYDVSKYLLNQLSTHNKHKQSKEKKLPTYLGFKF